MSLGIAYTFVMADLRIFCRIRLRDISIYTLANFTRLQASSLSLDLSFGRRAAVRSARRIAMADDLLRKPVRVHCLWTQSYSTPR